MQERWVYSDINIAILSLTGESYNPGQKSSDWGVV